MKSMKLKTSSLKKYFNEIDKSLVKIVKKKSFITGEKERILDPIEIQNKNKGI